MATIVKFVVSYARKMIIAKEDREFFNILP